MTGGQVGQPVPALGRDRFNLLSESLMILESSQFKLLARLGAQLENPRQLTDTAC
jgi:hypothetical protein